MTTTYIPQQSAEITITISDVSLINSIAHAVKMIKGVDVVTVHHKEATETNTSAVVGNDIDFIRSLHAVGGHDVPADDNGKGLVSDLKYMY